MNKDQLQQELKEKVKPGVKPSDLKKQGKNSQTNLNHGLLTPPPTPPLKPKQENIIIPPLENSNQPELLAKIKNLEEQNKSLIKNLTSQANQAKTTDNIQEKTFPCSHYQQTQPLKELSRIFGELKICRACSQQARKDAEQQKPNQTFLCATCQIIQKNPTWIKVAQNDPEYNLIQGQSYPFCSTCSPKIKEFNEYDLITDDLWDKYPYSSASEILELEFGIQRKEEPW